MVMDREAWCVVVDGDNKEWDMTERLSNNIYLYTHEDEF